LLVAADKELAELTFGAPQNRDNTWRGRRRASLAQVTDNVAKMTGGRTVNATATNCQNHHLCLDIN